MNLLNTCKYQNIWYLLFTFPMQNLGLGVCIQQKRKIKEGEDRS
jgi:hypothetical protein